MTETARDPNGPGNGGTLSVLGTTLRLQGWRTVGLVMASVVMLLAFLAPPAAVVYVNSQGFQLLAQQVRASNDAAIQQRAAAMASLQREHADLARAEREQTESLHVLAYILTLDQPDRNALRRRMAVPPSLQGLVDEPPRSRRQLEGR
jgi:hypothetical protein